MLESYSSAELRFKRQSDRFLLSYSDRFLFTAEDNLSSACGQSFLRLFFRLQRQETTIQRAPIASVAR